MQVSIMFKNIDPNPEHKEYVEEKMAGLGKVAGSFDDESATAHVEIKKNGDKDYHEQVELHAQVKVPGMQAVTDVLAGEITEAADIAVDKLAAQLRKHKDKHKHHPEKVDMEALTADAADLYDVDPNEAQ